MATADEQIRISTEAKRELERRRRPGESFNDVLERLLEEEGGGDFDEGFGRWSDTLAERVRDDRRRSKEERKRRRRDRAEDRP